MKLNIRLVLAACLTLLAIGCKDDNPTNPPIPVADCLLTEEVFSGGSTIIELKYEYNNQREPSHMTKFNSDYLETYVFDVYSNQVKMGFLDATGEPARFTFDYFGGDIFTGCNSSACWE
jgi:hypothetical protein